LKGSDPGRLNIDLPRSTPLYGGAFFLYGLGLFAHLLTFDGEEGEDPLAVGFAGCHRDPLLTTI
jgi:hypothetical protein